VNPLTQRAHDMLRFSERGQSKNYQQLVCTLTPLIFYCGFMILDQMPLILVKSTSGPRASTLKRASASPL
jgi:hypothetical protein